MTTWNVLANVNHLFKHWFLLVSEGGGRIELFKRRSCLVEKFSNRCFKTKRYTETRLDNTEYRDTGGKTKRILNENKQQRRTYDIRRTSREPAPPGKMSPVWSFFVDTALFLMAFFRRFVRSPKKTGFHPKTRLVIHDFITSRFSFCSGVRRKPTRYARLWEMAPDFEWN